jgi:HEAT repeat protein
MNYLPKRVLVQFFVLTFLATVATSYASPPSPMPFEGSKPDIIIRVLKVMRSPEYSAAAPAILPLLHHENPNVVRDTCRTLAVIGNKDDIPSIELLLKDNRSAVRDDAQNAIHELSMLSRPAFIEEQKSSAELVKSDPGSVIRMLKLLRHPEYSAMVPAILPFLHHDSGNVIRDTCRTLAVIGNKDVIPNIQPLLQDKREDVRKDAQDAIAILKAKI